jgi:hypothetical protein
LHDPFGASENVNAIVRAQADGRKDVGVSSFAKYMSLAALVAFGPTSLGT